MKKVLLITLFLSLLFPLQAFAQSVVIGQVEVLVCFFAICVIALLKFLLITLLLSLFFPMQAFAQSSAIGQGEVLGCFFAVCVIAFFLWWLSS